MQYPIHSYASPLLDVSLCLLYAHNPCCPLIIPDTYMRPDPIHLYLVSTSQNRVTSQLSPKVSIFLTGTLPKWKR